LTDFSVNGEVALVTGSSRGLGAGIAVALARAGADVAITARDERALGETAGSIEALGRRVLPVSMELTELESIHAAAGRVERELGPISILVNNAGVNIPRPAVDLTADEWDAVLDTNLRGLFFCSQSVAGFMIPRRRGKIINISSAAGVVASPERAHYGASKAGVNMLTRNLAYEWAKHNITVNAVAPTFVETELAAVTLNRPEMREYFLARVPLGRFGTVADVAAAVVYLASPAADFVTGVVLPVDGGLQMV
jgi:NAD(P)-dependent dehydrogenase (short-subunit alcohol dehydrogenase family)